eukprot:scaffold22893_cov27-Tisochrysis_lutea.AAC.10
MDSCYRLTRPRGSTRQPFREAWVKPIMSLSPSTFCRKLQPLLGLVGLAKKSASVAVEARPDECRALHRA